MSMNEIETEKLESELSELSARMSSDPIRFQDVRDELRRRREGNIGTVNDQPPPKVTTHDELLAEARQTIATLTTKIISMESEQAKLVIEAEMARADAVEIQRRLTLTCQTAELRGKEIAELYEKLKATESNKLS